MNMVNGTGEGLMRPTKPNFLPEQGSGFGNACDHHDDRGCGEGEGW